MKSNYFNKQSSSNSKDNSYFRNDDQRKTDSNQGININAGDEEFVKKSYEKYSSMNQNEALSELVKEINKGKQNGSFNADQILQSIDQMSAFLPKDQVENMKKLLGSLK